MKCESWHALIYIYTTLYHYCLSQPILSFYFFGLTALAAEPSSPRKAIIPQWSQKGEASKTELHATTNNSFLLNPWHIWAIQSSQKPSQTCAETPHGGDGALATPPRRTRNGPLAWAHDATGIGAPLQCQNDATTATGESRRARRLPVPSLEINKASISVDSRDRMGPLVSFDMFWEYVMWYHVKLPNDTHEIENADHVFQVAVLQFNMHHPTLGFDSSSVDGSSTWIYIYYIYIRIY